MEGVKPEWVEVRCDDGGDDGRSVGMEAYGISGVLT